MAYTLSTLALLAATAYAKTDLTGCTTTDMSSPAGASQAWYVPGTGELCDFLDCGGGRAPPKYDVPGCPQYTGTQTYSPSFLAGYGMPTASQVADASAAPVMTMSSSASASVVEIEVAMTSSTAVSSSSSAVAVVASTSMVSDSPANTMTTSAVTPAPYGNPANTVGLSAYGGLVGTNSTTIAASGSGSPIASNSAAPSQFDSGASENVRAWAGSAGFFAGLGAVIAAL